ncbi:MULTISPECIES: radical SAM protein [Citrobacter]|uniref:radical SAM protein n=1 Tax=Citrobacter TaxID=544 RepID=UPI000F8F44B4|nr:MULTISPECIES: radical SAM protein [Citrobacter]EHU7373979.1 radical SAM protein [Citrobacter freundii]MDG9957132.1 radical SAM protein [Citrobacter portucalensis]MDM2812962.1 radical SAM protein [Citrobacter sp. Cpo103]MDN4359595.1 radical SAM protein [Citrobacter portucalensis]MDN4363962.1 radical SAM protein [Citrobacter portucalensis]
MDVSDDVLNVVIDHQKCLQPVEVYRGLQQGNVRLVQFIPLVKHDGSGHLTDESVTSEAWGRFLITIFDIWVREDINQISIQLFDKTLRQWCGLTAQIERQTMSSMNTRCQTCSLFQYYHGDCPAYCEDNGKGVLCAGYQAFFSHTAPHMRVMRDLLKQHRSPMELMAMLR